jgi:hypothetical protein
MDEIFIDEANYITLQRDRNEQRDDRTAVLYRDTGSTDVIVFKTNIQLDKFDMTLNNGGDFPNPSDKKIIENDRFKIEIKTEDGVNYFEFTTLQPYAEAQDNPSTLTVKAGRIEFDITIIQKNEDPFDWIDGGEQDF